MAPTIQPRRERRGAAGLGISVAVPSMVFSVGMVSMSWKKRIPSRVDAVLGSPLQPDLNRAVQPRLKRGA